MIASLWVYTMSKALRITLTTVFKTYSKPKSTKNKETET